MNEIENRLSSEEVRECYRVIYERVKSKAIEISTKTKLLDYDNQSQSYKIGVS